MDKQDRSRLIQQYGAGPDVLQAAWNACSTEARHWKPSNADWSAHEIVIHCGDSETFAATRIRLLLAEPKPMIVGYDQDTWVRTFDYGQLPNDLAFAMIAAVRASTFHLIQSLDDRAWDAAGNHTEAGPYSAGDLLNIYGVHLHDHA
ncbi:MAG: DinB family protein, partial [Chloroflexota bacterium]|nr:DinB family protein [Chloroflexota bacterium]